MSKTMTKPQNTVTTMRSAIKLDKNFHNTNRIAQIDLRI